MKQKILKSQILLHKTRENRNPHIPDPITQNPRSSYTKQKKTETLKSLYTKYKKTEIPEIPYPATGNKIENPKSQILLQKMK